MTTTPNTTLADQLTPLATELADIQDQIAELQNQESGLKAHIRELVPGPDAYAAGGLTVQISSNRRFNPTLAATVIPAELLSLVSITTSVVDRKKVEVLCPDQLNACFIDYEFKVSLK